MFWNKLRKENKELKHLLHLHFDIMVAKLQELDQNKVYYMDCTGYSDEEIEAIKGVWEAVSKKVQWSLPPIIVANGKLSEIDKARIREMIK